MYQALFKPQSLAGLKVEVLCVILSWLATSTHTRLHTYQQAHPMHARTVYKVTLGTAHGTQGILLKNLSLNWFLLHSHIPSAKWHARIDFNKKETAIQLQTTVQPQTLFLTWE